METHNVLDLVKKTDDQDVTPVLKTTMLSTTLVYSARMAERTKLVMTLAGVTQNVTLLEHVEV